MGLMEDIGVYLSSNGQGAVGTAIFYGGRPDQPDDCLTLYEYSGPAPEMENSEDAFAWERPSLQMVSRSADPLAARNTIRAAWAPLVPLTNLWLTDDAGKKTLYREINPQQSPFQLGRDENRRFLWAVNFQIIKRPRPEL